MCEPRSGPYTVDRMGAVLVVDRGEHPEPGVSTAPVVERLDVLEHRGPGFGLGGPGAAVDEVLLQARVEALHRGVVEAVSAGSVGHLDPDEAAAVGDVLAGAAARLASGASCAVLGGDRARGCERGGCRGGGCVGRGWRPWFR